ncbi:MAG: anti-sigma factor [Flavobacteriales bacterium]
MNAAELIASGLLEAHVLGQTSRSEAVLVEHMRATDSGVRAELASVELALEQLAVAGAAPAPARVRAATLAAIGHSDNGRVIAMSRTASTGGTVRWLAAASVAALVVSAVGNWMLYSRVGAMEEQLSVMQNDRTTLAQELETQRTALDASNAQLAVVLNPHVVLVPLAGVDSTMDAAARLYWDPATKDVYLDVLRLPEPPAGKQYQLWALASGVPISAGMYDSSPDASKVQHMKVITEAQTFAVTLEDAGGVPSPTLSAMVLMGNV